MHKMINWLKNTYKSELQILIRSNAGHSKKRQKAKQDGIFKSEASVQKSAILS